jgi:hypothetical protein
MKFTNNLNIFINLILLFLLINSTYTRSDIIRKDIDPQIVSSTIKDLINKFYLEEGKEYNKYSINLEEYTVAMKFKFIQFNSPEIRIEQHKDVRWNIFTYLNPEIEFILSLEISNNNQILNSKNNSVSIIFNERDSPNLKFELKNIYAKILCDYIQFDQKTDNTYNFTMYSNEREFKNIEIILDTKNYIHFSKINKFLNDKKNNLHIFLLNSFCNYLKSIVSFYPIPDGVYLYKEAIQRFEEIKIFALENNARETAEKICINLIKEEKFNNIFPEIEFINVKVEFDIIYQNSQTSYSHIIPKIYYYPTTGFVPEETNFKIGNTTLSSILTSLFKKIVEDYIY